MRPNHILIFSRQMLSLFCLFLMLTTPAFNVSANPASDSRICVKFENAGQKHDHSITMSLELEDSYGTAAKSSSTESNQLSPDQLKTIFSKITPIHALTEKKKSIEPVYRNGSSKPRILNEVQTISIESFSKSAPRLQTQELNILDYGPKLSPASVEDELYVRFSQSMVPVGLAPAKSPPVQLRPQQPGTWRWHDDRTIIFLPEGGHWNQNTTFLARVTAGTKSQKGQVLKEEFYFEFTTGALNTRTPPKAIPNSSQIAHVSFDDAKLIPGKRLESSGKIHLFCLKFNNPVDKTYYKDLRLAVEKNTELARRRPVRSKHSLRPAYPAEIEKDEILCKLKSENAANSDCMLFVALLGQLSSGDRVRIFSDDCHKAKEWIICEHFRYVNCKGAKYISSAQEPSKQPLVLFFSNYIEPVDLGSDLIQISPPVKNVFISTNRNQLSIFGDFQTNKEYLIRISAELRDSNHTRLGKIYEQRVFIPQKKTYLYHHPRFQEEEEILTNLDPDSDKHYDLLSTGFSKLNVKVFEMGPEDFLAYCKIHQTETEAEKEGMLKALLEKRPLLLNKLIELEKPADEAKRTSIDLNECFNRGITQLLVTAEGLPKEGWKRDEFFTCHWLQCSKMDLSYWSDDENTVVSVNSSRNGEPLANVFVSSLDEPMLPLQTNSDGICILPLSRPHFLLARSASMNSKEQLIVPYDSYGWHYSEPRYKSHSQRDKYKAVLITDRTVYQPGEKIHFKGWIRQRSKDACGSWKLPEQIKQNLTIEFSGKRKQNLSLNSYGTFSGSIDIAETLKLGADNITAWTGDQCIGSRQIMLAEYRQPEFDLSVECSNSSNLTKNLPAHFVARASDYTRAKISGGACNWSLECSAGSFAPPGWKDFSFSPRESLDMHTRGIESYTDKNGESHIKASINSSYPGPIDLRVKTAVQNSNMQIREASCRQLVHSSNIYAGMKLTSSNMVAGSPLRPEFIVVDTTGKPLENVPIQVELEKYSSSNNRNKIDSVRTSVRKWKLPSSLSPVFLDLMVEDTGDYRMSAIVSSANGSNKCSQDFKIEVAAKPDIAHVRLPATPHPIELLPDKPTYEPGDIARIRIKTPISEDSYGIAIFKRAGIISAHSFQLKNHEHTLSIPIETRYMPNLDLKVFLLGPDKNFSLPKATGQEISPLFFTEWREKDIRLEVSDKSKLLKVKIVTDSDCKAPAENCSIRVCVQDFKDRPLRACEVCAIVVNEADLSLGNNPFAINLLQSFNEKLESHLFKRSSRSCQQHERELELYTPYYRYGSGLDQTRSKFSGSNQEGETEAEYTRADPNKLSSLNLRKNFSPLALFAAHLITDRNGEAKVNFKLPDSIGKYRIVAFAGSSNDQFGEVKSELTVKSPLILRPTFPRFMRVGDKSEFPVTIQNNTTKDMATTVAYRSSLSSKQQQGQGHQLIVPAMDSVRIGVKASAEHAGPADFQICALSQDASDSIQGSFIVLPASQEIKFSTKGVLSTAKQIASHQVELPEHCLSEAGGLELRFGPSRLVELTGAEIYLGSYQFQCSEQLSSRILLCSALMPCSYPLDLKNLSTTEQSNQLNKRIELQKCIDILESRQNDHGSFGLWKQDSNSSPFLNAQVMHSLIRARLSGYKVSDTVIKRGLNLLNNKFANYGRHSLLYTNRLGKRDFTSEAYQLYVKSLAGSKMSNDVRLLLKDRNLEECSEEALCWLLMVLDQNSDRAERQRLNSYLQNRLHETSEMAWLESKGYGVENESIYYSDLRPSALYLSTLLKSKTNSALKEKLANWLIASQKNGRWSNTQENALIAIALFDYFQETETLDSSQGAGAIIWIGDSEIADTETSSQEKLNAKDLFVPISDIMDQTNGNELTLQNRGSGKLYYRLNWTVFPNLKSKVQEINCGLGIRRTYEAVNHPDSVRLDENGIWHIKAGSLVRVRLSVESNCKHGKIAITDPLPSGFESLNQALRGTATASIFSRTSTPETNPKAKPWLENIYVEHLDMRSSQTELFGNLSSDKGATTYMVLATCKGRFVVPPAEIVEMYVPDQHGSSASDTVIVE